MHLLKVVLISISIHILYCYYYYIVQCGYWGFENEILCLFSFPLAIFGEQSQDPKIRIDKDFPCHYNRASIIIIHDAYVHSQRRCTRNIKFLVRMRLYEKNYYRYRWKENWDHWQICTFSTFVRSRTVATFSRNRYLVQEERVILCILYFRCDTKVPIKESRFYGVCTIYFIILFITSFFTSAHFIFFLPYTSK